MVALRCGMMIDLKYALRSLLKRPGFTLIAIATLALGIGASTAIFSVVDAVLLRPLPYPNQDRLVEVSELNEAGRGMAFTEPNFDDLAARNRSFEAMANYWRSSEAVAGGSEPVRTNVCGISPDFFRVLGRDSRCSVALISAETVREGNEVAVVSYGFWKRMLGGRTNLEGTSLRFANRSFAVIGVLPPETEFPAGVDVWFPFRALYPPFESRTGHNFRVIARLRPGVSFPQASDEVAIDRSRIESELRNANRRGEFWFALVSRTFRAGYPRLALRPLRRGRRAARDRVFERRESSARARRLAAEGSRVARGARRVAWKIGAAIHRRSSSADARRGRARHVARRLERAAHRRPLSRRSAARRARSASA